MITVDLHPVLGIAGVGADELARCILDPGNLTPAEALACHLEAAAQEADVDVAIQRGRAVSREDPRREQWADVRADEAKRLRALADRLRGLRVPAESAHPGASDPAHDHDMATTHKTDPDARQTPDDKILDNPQSGRARPGDAPAKDADVLERERVQVPPGTQGPTNERPHAPTPERTNLVGRE